MRENQPLHVLKSYLAACEIPFDINGETVQIITKDKGVLEVTLGADTKLLSNSIIVGSKEIVSPVAAVYLKALHTVTKAAGYESPVPVNRGEAPSNRINYKDDFEQVYLRHSVFRRSPNPRDSSVLDKYNKTVSNTAARAFKRYRWILEPMGFGVEDLISIGQVHAITFIHYYAASENTVENIKLLTQYLKQRYSELAKLCHKKAVNSTCLPQTLKTLPANEEDDSFTHFLNLIGDEYAIEEDEEYVEGSYRLVATDGTETPVEIQRKGLMGLNIYVNRHLLTPSEVSNLKSKLDSGLLKMTPVEVAEPVVKRNSALSSAMSPYQRRAKAKNLLFKELDKLSLEERNIALAYAVYSQDYEPDARAMAKKLCEELCCPKCKKKVAVGYYCNKCNVEAVPRYGVDYKEVKEQLTPRVVCVKCNQKNCDCDNGSKTIQIGNKSFNLKSKPATKIVFPDNSHLIESMVVSPWRPITNHQPKVKEPTVPAPKPIKEKVPRAPESEIKAAEQKMIKEFWDKLPEQLHCPRHNNGVGGMTSKDMFKPLVALRYDNGMPKRIRRHSYCIPCLRAYSKKSN